MLVALDSEEMGSRRRLEVDAAPSQQAGHASLADSETISARLAGPPAAFCPA
jgi:hypothetical protein